MATKNFIPPPQDVLQGNPNKSFNISVDGVLPKGVNILNKILPINVPLFDINDLPVGVGVFGLPIYDSLRFLAGSYESVDGSRVINYNSLVIDTCVFEASQTKNIIKTVVQGRDKTIKEYINSGDIDIVITGALVNNSTNYYPSRDVDTFSSIMKVPRALEVRSKFLNLLDITHIVIESWKFTQVAGLRNVQGFVINAVADIPASENDLINESV